MPSATNTITINRPPDAVFAFLADGTSGPQWRPGILEIAHEGGSGVGARYRQGVKGPGGRRAAADFGRRSITPAASSDVSRVDRRLCEIRPTPCWISLKCRRPNSTIPRRRERA